MARPSRLRIVLGTVAVSLVLLASGIRPDRAPSELERQYAPAPSRFVRIDGVRTHLRDEGSGPPLVLIHGTSSSLHTWDGWVRELGAHRRIVRFDLPGFGLTGPASDHDYRIARYARFVVAVMDSLHIERADIAGNSLGGRIAATVALTNPDRVNKLVLVDAAGLSGNPVPKIFQLAKSPLTRGLLTWISPRFVIRASVFEVFHDDRKVTEAVVDRYYAMALREGNRQALVDRLNGPFEPFLDDRLGDIHAPTLILWGTGDIWIPPSNAPRFARGIPNATVRMYEAGHIPMEELPVATARDVAAFLDAPRVPAAQGATE